MQTGLFIRGGWAKLPKNGTTYTGLPSRIFCGPFFFRFQISDRHTAYEWAMVLADRHPYSPWWGDLKQSTVEAMQNRETVLACLPKSSNGIYPELKAAFETGCLNPLRSEWCTDHREVLDFTRCVLGVDQVLPVLRRRRDTGWLISKLLAAYDRSSEQATASASGLTPLDSPARPSRRRGPKPVKLCATVKLMKEQIKDGTLTLIELDGLKEEAMQSKYGVSRDTARKARQNVLSELRAEETPTNSDQRQIATS